MPLSAAMFRSERKNPVPQCPPRLNVEMLTPVIWSRVPNNFLKPELGKVSERHGWMVECTEPLTMMALHIPEENRYEEYTWTCTNHVLYESDSTRNVLIVLPVSVCVVFTGCIFFIAQMY